MNIKQDLKVKVGEKEELQTAYYIGNKEILYSKSIIGIVGSTLINDSTKILINNITQKAKDNNIPIISGGAKGCDTEALTSIIEKGGKAIYVLPCGIEDYYKKINDYSFKEKIEDGKILLLSLLKNGQFQSWQAMQRNSIIYNHSKRVYVSQISQNTTNFDYGTLGGAILYGFNMDREVYIKNDMLGEDEKSNILLEIGGNFAIPINIQGEKIKKVENNFKEILKNNISKKKDEIKEIIDKKYGIDFKTYLDKYISIYKNTNKTTLKTTNDLLSSVS